MAIQTATVGQKDNHLRHALRKGRLTASNLWKCAEEDHLLLHHLDTQAVCDHTHLL